MALSRTPRATTMLRKVPEITALFWAVKLLGTAMGEATSDFLVAKINPYVAVTLGGIGLLVALVLQFSAKKYEAWKYWLAVSMVAVFGTMAADGAHVQLGVPYVASAAVFAIALAVIFAVWYKSEGSLSIHTITTRKREYFYWATVLATFALGTAVGDLTAHTFGLGYFSSGILFAALMLVPAAGFWLFGLSEVATFWTAYILTRPLGASFADWFGKPHNAGGLGFGDGHVGVALIIVIVIFVGYMTFDHREARHELGKK